MKFRTELKISDPRPVIDYSKKILCIGSCFAQHLHTHLSKLKINSFINPCGITYNPISIANSLYYLRGAVEIREEDIFEHKGIFSHFDFHSQFSGISQLQVSKNIKESIHRGREFSQPDVLILSLGTAFTYFRTEEGDAVNNCHKLPQQSFEKRLLTVEEVVEVLDNVLLEMRRDNPGLTVITTVSPVRHLRDGMVQNNISKATLLLAITKLKDVIYFPSYELLMDDLRDYRYYDRDLVHPSAEAIEYILEFFIGQFCSADESSLRKKVLSIQNNLAHRPFFPESREHQRFLQQLLVEMKTIKDEYGVDFNKEMSEVLKKIEGE